MQTEGLGSTLVRKGFLPFFISTGEYITFAAKTFIVLETGYRRWNSNLVKHAARGLPQTLGRVPTVMIALPITTGRLPSSRLEWSDLGLNFWSRTSLGFCYFYSWCGSFKKCQRKHHYPTRGCLATICLGTTADASEPSFHVRSARMADLSRSIWALYQAMRLQCKKRRELTWVRNECSCSYPGWIKKCQERLLVRPRGVNCIAQHQLLNFLNRPNFVSDRQPRPSTP